MGIRHLASFVFITCILGLGEYVNIVTATTVIRGGLRSVTLAILPSDSSLLSERSSATKWTSSHLNAESIETSRYSTTTELLNYSTNTAELPKYSSNTAELPKYSTNTISIFKRNNTDQSNSSSFSTLSLSSLNSLSSTSLKRPLSIRNTIKLLSTPFIEPTPLSVFSSFSVTTYFSSSKYLNTDFSFSTPFLMHNSSSFNISSGSSKSSPSPSSNDSSSSQPSAILFSTSSPFLPSSLSAKLSAQKFASNSSLFDIHPNSTSFLRPRPSMSTTIISYSSFTYISQANASPLSASTISPSPKFSNHSIGTKIKNTMISYPLSSTESFHSTPNTRNRSVVLSTTFTTYHISLIHLNKSQSFNMSSLRTKIRSSSVEGKSTAFISPKFMSTISAPKSVYIQKVIPNFLEFNGKLIVSMNDPLKSVDELKQVSENIETILDEAFRALQGYIYSKVLQITRRGESRLQCPFKVFIKEPSNETWSSLKEKLKMYNRTHGFGEFVLYSVDIVTHEKSSQKDKIKPWTVIVITILCALCIVLAIALVCLQRRFKKMKTKREINDGNKSYPVFDGIDEHPNIPLKLKKSRVATAESRKPLKSDSTSHDSENEGSNVGNDEEIGNNLERRSSEESIDSSDHNTNNKEEDLDALQINEVKEEDETKFSTFSRKK